MKILYNGWDREYEENREMYHILFDQAMVKEVEGSTEGLESALSSYTSRSHCVAVANATDALRFSLWGIGPGDEVLVSDFSWISTSSCISMVGATPVFCDIDLHSYHISIDSIKRMTTDKTKALIYTHLYGSMSDTKEIEHWCINNGIRFIEDSAQSLGSSVNGRKAGTIGECSSYSFNGNKVIAGISGGGMFMTDNKEHADYVKRVRRHGKDNDFAELGYNSKMFITNADIIQYRLTQMPKWQEKRNEIAGIYTKELKYDVICQNVPVALEHNFHKFVIRFEDKEQRKRVKDGLKAVGLNASIHYEKPLSENSLYITEHHRKDNCTNSRIASDTVMSLPIHAWLTDEEIDKICNTILMLS